MSGKSFTISFKRHVNSLITKCGVCPAYNPSCGGTHPRITKCLGLWDTGASGSVIDKTFADQIGLIPDGVAKVNHANGSDLVNTYTVNILLPNEVGFHSIKVTSGVLCRFHLLIGMDIISKGDFSISNPPEGTVFSFRIPSLAKIDFVADDNLNYAKKHTPLLNHKIQNNSPCPCGSGLSYKKCCKNKS